MVPGQRESMERAYAAATGHEPEPEHQGSDFILGKLYKDCGKGRYRVNDKDESKNDPKRCDACPEGYYQDSKGQASCLPCLPGMYYNVSGLQMCFECGDGKYSNQTNAPTCERCQIGETQSVPGEAPGGNGTTS